MGANLTGAELWEANLAGASLLVANLTGANLWHADLTGAKLWLANLTGANLEEAMYDTDTMWPDGFDPVAAGAKLVESEAAQDAG